MATDLTARVSRALGERYAVEREIGRGGMAIVYLARDHKHHRSVAIKVLKPELVPALGTDRFLREIEIAARLTQPNILLQAGQAVVSDFGIARAVLHAGDSLTESGIAVGTLAYMSPWPRVLVPRM